MQSVASARVASPQMRVRSIPAVKLWLLHASTVGLPVFLFLFGAPPEWTLGLGGLAMTVIYLTIGYRESKRQEFWLSPLSFFFLWYSVGYGLSAIYAAGRAHDPGYMNIVARIVTGPDLAAGYILSLCGAVALHGGFVWVRGFQEKNPVREARKNDRSDFRLWTLFLLLGLATLVRPQYFDSIGVARSILQLAPFGVMLSFCSLPREYFRLSNAVYSSYLLVGNLLLIIVAFYDGSKYYSMLAFLPLLSAMMVRKRWRKLLPFAFAAGVVMYLFIVAPVLMRSRGIKGVDSQWQKLQIAAEESANSFQEDAWFAFQEETEKFLNRQFESTAAGFIVSDVRDLGFRYGETMTNLTYAFIPRILWKDKPMVTRGDWFTAYLGGSGSEEESTTSTGIYSAGELYWNFGLPGVFVGMFVMGCLFGLVATGVGPGPHGLAVPMLLFMNAIARIVDEASATELSVLMIYLIILLVVYNHSRKVVAKS